MRSLPATDARYWATIVSACAIGETLGDYVSHGLNLGYGFGSLGLLTLFAIVLALEIRATTPSQVRYWAAVVITCTTGTTIADFLTRSLKFGYGGGTASLLVVFVLLVFMWRRRPVTAAAIVHHADDTVLPRPDRSALTTDTLYWSTILVISTFGTTLGDFVADGLDLGPAKASLVLGALLAVVVATDLFAKTPNKARYWAAIVITSTVGATFGDYLTKDDGLDLGFGVGSAILIAVFVLILVAGNFIGRPGGAAPRHSQGG